MNDVKGLLFLCVANSARSQMAEGLARERLGDQVLVQSAGSAPSQLNRFAIAVMAEVGIDLTSHASKPVEAIDPSTVSTVITLCAEEVCPVFLGDAEKLHWPQPDPASVGGSDEAHLEAFRLTRDAIDAQLARFIEERRLLDPPAA